MNNRQLFRNKQKGRIGGVCAGLGEYFEVDITLIRALFLVALLGFGSGFLMYVILWIVLPERTQNFQDESNVNDAYYAPEDNANFTKGGKFKKENVIGGLVLITLGVIFLADEFIPWISFQKLWPLILISIGIGMLYTNSKKNKN